MTNISNDHQNGSVSAVTEDFRVGKWHVRVDLHRFERDDRIIQVEPRVFQAFLYLARHAGSVVSRETLLAEVWSDVVVNEEALTRAISELRHIFGDDPRSPRYIETIRKGGYRLIAEVREEGEEPEVDSAPDEAAESPPPRWPSSPVRAAVIAGGCLVVALVLWVGVAGNGSEPVVLEAQPFTSFPGEELRPSLSPDGSRVAFSWAGAEGRNYDIYVKQRNTETPLRLTRNRAVDSAPTWSPDGSTIAFVRQSRRGSEILIVPAIGGASRPLFGGVSLIDSVDWSPDGNTLVFSVRRRPEEPCGLAVLDLESRDVTQLTSPPEQYTGDIWPVYSPDGLSIAFVRGDRIGLNDIYRVPAQGGKVDRITHGGSAIRGLDWDASGEDIIYSSIVKGPFALWTVNVESGQETRMPVNVEWISNPSRASGAGTLVLEARRFELNIWRISLENPEIPRHSERPLIASTRIDSQASYSPDGRTIAFISSRSGPLEIWVCAADGSNPLQLTDLGASLVGNPRWSPDGRYIALYTPADEHSAIFIVDVATGQVRQLSKTMHNDRVSNWSRDGRWLYFGSDRSGHWQVYKIALDTEEVVQVTETGGITAAESCDGQTLFFVKPDSPGIWKKPVEGGSPELVVESLALRNWDNWVVRSDEIIFVRSDVSGSAIGTVDLATGGVRTLARTPSRPVRRSLAVSPDGRSILYSRLENAETDIMIIESLD